MPPHKNAYLARIRNETAYPWFRTFVEILFLVTIVLGVLSFLAGVVLGFYYGYAAIGMLLPLLGGVLLMALGVIIKEASLMVADIADSITDLNCRYESPNQ